MKKLIAIAVCITAISASAGAQSNNCKGHGGTVQKESWTSGGKDHVREQCKDGHSVSKEREHVDKCKK